MARLITGKWACFSFNPMLEVLKLRVSGPEDRHIQCRWCKPPERVVKRISGLKGRHTGACVGPSGLNRRILRVPVARGLLI